MHASIGLGQLDPELGNIPVRSEAKLLHNLFDLRAVVELRFEGFFGALARLLIELHLFQNTQRLRALLGLLFVLLRQRIHRCRKDASNERIQFTQGVTRERTRNLQRKAPAAKLAKVDVAVGNRCAEKLPQDAIGICLLRGHRVRILRVFLPIHRVSSHSIDPSHRPRYQLSNSPSGPPIGKGGMCSGGTAATDRNSLASGVRDRTSIAPIRGLKTCQPTWPESTSQQPVG